MSVIHTPTPWSDVSVRLGSSLIAAAVITFALFVLMQQLIAQDELAHPPQSVSYTPVELGASTPESDVIIRHSTPPVKPEYTKRELSHSSIEPADTTTAIIGTGFKPDALSIDTSPVMGSGQQRSNKEATPLFRVEPRFPAEALRQGQSGWVRLRFNIDESGAVTDINVIAAEPRNVFDRAAISALRRWKYQPQIVDGIAVKQTDLQVQLDFQLQNE